MNPADFLTRESHFLMFPHLPIDRIEVKEDIEKYKRSTGHPYGTSALFRSLGKHHGPAGPNREAALLRAVMTESQAQSKVEAAKYHPLGVPAKALGMTGPDDPKFRKVYDEFAVAAALGPHAAGLPTT